MDSANFITCESEPIHLAGGILPHGAMVVLDESTLQVVQVAGDTQHLLGASAGSLLGRNADAFLSTKRVALLRQFADEPHVQRPRHVRDPILRAVANTPADASVHRIDGLMVVEWEAAGRGDLHAADPLGTVRAMIRSTEDAVTTRDFCEAAAKAVRQVTGYARVVVYRFMEDDSGWVIAEDRDGTLPALLNLHFPASDIPRQARALYVRNPLRLIARVDYEPAMITPPVNPRTGRPLDMSFATLRDVSPVHREYLRNMGVSASMSVSVMREGRLWGLIACHHDQPLYLPRHIRTICELFGSVFSMQLEARERTELLNARLATRDTLKTLMNALSGAPDPVPCLLQRPGDLLHCIDGGAVSLRVGGTAGVAVMIGGTVSTFGETLPEELLTPLAAWLRDRMPESGVLATDRLGDLWPPARQQPGHPAGLLAASLSDTAADFALWFRPEVLQAIDWAGDPTKQAVPGPGGGRLAPRQSFAAWRETVRGRASPWAGEDIGAAIDLRAAMTDLIRHDKEADERRHAVARRQQSELAAELEERTNTTLSVIRSLSAAAGEDDAAINEYVADLERRIQSMAHSDSLIVQSNWQGVALRDVFSEEFRGRPSDHGHVVFDGPPVILKPQAALALALAVHALADSAARYGALSVAAGRVTIGWSKDATGSVDLHWVEAGGPAPGGEQPGACEPGMIEQALTLEPGARADLRFALSGVECDVVLPASAVAG